MWKCTKCGGNEVETLSWVDLNTGEEQEGEVGEYYCRSCEAHTDVSFDEGPDDSDLKDENDEE